jgi:hypothetical protein
MAQTVHHGKRRVRSTREKLLIAAAVLGGLVTLAVLLGLVQYLRATATPPLPTEAQQSQAATASGGYQVAPVQSQLQQAALSAVAAPGQPVSLYLRPEDVIQQLAPGLAKSGVQDLHVYLGQGTVAAQGVVPVGKRSVHATVRLRPQAVNGALRLELVEAKIGTMPMPHSLRKRLEAELAKGASSRESALSQVYLDSVQVAPGLLTLTGRPQLTR